MRFRCSFLLLLVAPFAALAQVADSPARILAYDVATLGLDKSGTQPRSVRVYGRDYALELEPNPRALDGLESGQREAIAARGDEFLRGYVAGSTGSWVRLSRVAGEWSGALHDGTDLFLLDPPAQLAGLLPLAPPPEARLIGYRVDDVLLTGSCGDADDALPAGKRLSYAGLLPAVPARPKAANEQLLITVVTDTEFAAVHGTNAASVVASRINVIDGIYSNQLQISIALGHLRALGSNGTLTTTDSQALLPAFRTYMTSGAGASIPKNGLNHLFSGKDFDGSIVGVAYISVLCSASYGYGIDQVRAANQTTALTIAHEMGHNFGAPHDGQAGSACSAQAGSWLMSPSLNGSDQFSPCSQTQMADDINAATCFVPLSSGSVIHSNGFE